MILFITSRSDSTADYFGDFLRAKKAPFIRIDTDNIVNRLKLEWQPIKNTPYFTYDEVKVNLSDITGIWFRRPKTVKFSSKPSAEATHAALEFTTAFEAILELLPETQWINHPALNVKASHKIEQLARAKAHGLLIPESIVTQTPSIAYKFFAKHSGQIITKPLASGYINRKNPSEDTLIYTNKVSAKRESDFRLVAQCPTLFQKEITKTADVRITVVDNQVHAVFLYANENKKQRLDIRRNEMIDVRYAPAQLPAAVSKNLFRMLRSYRLRFAAVDMCIDKAGFWHFLEINPNGQWAWLDIAGSTNIAESLYQALTNSPPASP
jgi:glutathione synthase/RimK-type ligase-like ATP-grasp enzyme